MWLMENEKYWLQAAKELPPLWILVVDYVRNLY